MKATEITQHENGKMELDFHRLALATLFIIGIGMLLIFASSADGNENAVRKNSVSDNKVINKTLGLKGPEGKTPGEMGPAGKNQSTGKTDQKNRALRTAESSPGDEHQPYYIASPD